MGLLVYSPDLNAMQASDHFAKNGYIDLRAWNFKTHGIVSLGGQWQFHWNQLIPPKDIKFPPKDFNWISVPGSWNSQQSDQKDRGGQGYATLALKLDLEDRDIPLSLFIHEFLTAYELFVNGKSLCKIGKVGATRETIIPEYRPIIIDLPPGKNSLVIVIHLSNFHHRLGGPWSKILLGTETSLRQAASHRLVINIFMMGSIFIMGLYHLCLYLLRRKEAPPLYLGIFCCLITLRSLVTNERYLHVLFPGISWEVLLKIEYLCFYLAVPVFGLFIWALFPKEFSRTVLKTIKIFAALFSLLVLLTPAWIYSHSVQVFQGFTILGCLYLFIVLHKAAQKKRPGVRSLLLGFGILFVSILLDILTANGVLETGFVLQAGMFAFVFSQAFILSHRFSSTYEQVENQANDLLIMNKSLTREISVREKLEASLVESHEQFKDSRIALILGLAKLAEYRDTDTGTHLERIREYSRILAADLAETKAYGQYITQDYIKDIYHSSILHDIGKIGIVDAILLKPDKLTHEEFEIMKTHTRIGGDAITDIASKIKTPSFLTLATHIAYNHHEKWDGSGYPKGLKAKEIPLCARIAALADVYDALTSERPYKDAFSHEKAMEIILKDSGTHFDPKVVEAFCRQSEQIKQVRKKLLDT